MKCPPKKREVVKVPQTSDIMEKSKIHNTEEVVGRRKSTIKTACRHTHFTWEERLKLEYFYEGKGKYSKTTSPTELGVLFCKNERTIRRELKRGLVVHKKSDLSTKIVYSAEYAHNDAVYKNSAKGPQLKLGSDQALAKEIKRLVKNEKYSPYAIIQHFKKNGWPSNTRISEKTIYNYIQSGYISDLKESDLLYAGRRRKPKKGPRKHSRVQNAERSISKRPKEANERTEFGHWEADTVYSSKGCKNKRCLFVCTERKYRLEFIISIPDRTAKSVVAVFKYMEMKLGTELFQKIFKTITPDNGSEFSDVEGMENSSIKKGKKTRLFFAHPYSSFERGTNENYNGIIRRFIPKGSNIGEVETNKIKDIQKWMNNYPRKILNGDSPFEAMAKEFAELAENPKIKELFL